jgi:colicin import membrane protein
MFKFIKEHSGSLIFSVVLHGAIIAALVTGFFKFASSPTPQPAPELAIQATVVDERQVLAEMRRQEQEKSAAERQVRERADQLRREQEAETQRLEELKRQREQEEENERLRVQQRQQEDVERRREAELQAKRKAEAEARARAQAEAERKRKEETERKRRQEEEHRKAVEARQRAGQEAELKRRMADEERRRVAVESGLLAQYVAQIQTRIQRAWIRPPNARQGLKCVVNVTQAPGGTVLSVSIGECNGDEVVRRSIEAAVHRASPLPQPADPTLFEKNLRLEFKPDD